MPNSLASVAALSFGSQDPRHPSIVRYDVIPVRAQLTTEYTKIFSNDLDSGKCIIDCFRVCNRSAATDTTFSLAIVIPAQSSPWNSAADAIADYKAVSVVANETYEQDQGPIYLDAGDEVWMKAGAADCLNVNLSLRVEQ